MFSRFLLILTFSLLLISSKLKAQYGFIKLIDTAIVSNDTTFKMIGLGQNITVVDSYYYYSFFLHDTFSLTKNQFWLTKTNREGKKIKINKLIAPTNTGFYGQYYGKPSIYFDRHFYDVILYYDTNIFFYNCYLIKYDTALNLKWKKKICFNPLIDSNYNNNAIANLTIADNGNIILNGFEGDTQVNANSTIHVDNLIMIYDTAGNKLNSFNYPISINNSRIMNIERFNNRNYALYSKSMNLGSSLNSGFIGLNDSFQLVQNHLLTDSIFIGQPILFHKFNENKLIYLGSTDTLHTLGYSKWVIAMLDTNFHVLWKRLFNLENNPLSPIFDMIVTSDKKIVFCGDAIIDSCGINIADAGWLSKLDSNGKTLWDRRYFFRRNCQTSWFGLTEAEDGNLLAAGSISPPFNGIPLLPQHVWIIKVDSNGKVNPSDSGFINPCAEPNAIIEVGNDARQIVNLYPNPANNYLELIYNLHSNGKLQILDISGKLLFQSELNSNDHETRIDISNFSNGIYFLKITTKDKDETVKFVKE
jgi:hypothetical protein